ncbi:hypothetical protein D3C83_253450 [compost metagenome]
MFRVNLGYQSHLLQQAHALGFLGAHQVALAGMSPQDLAIGRDLEALGGAALRFQLQFYLTPVFRHDSCPL